MSEKHSYSYVIGNDKYGRYVSKNPNEAAKKALKTIFMKNGGKNPKHIKMVLNNGRNDKFYLYKTFIYELEEPIVREVNGEEIKYRYEFKVERK